MPSPPALAEITAVTGDDDIDDDEFFYSLGMLRGDGVGGRAAPVVADQEKFLMAKRFGDEPPDIIADRALVVATQRPGAVTQPAQVGRDHGVVRCERRNGVAPFVPRLRPAM